MSDVRVKTFGGDASVKMSVWRHLRAEDCSASPRRPRGHVCVHVWVETWRKQFGDSLEIDLERGLPELP